MEALKHVWNLWDSIYKILIVISLLYIGYELHSIKVLSQKNASEFDFATSKLDYVTSDVNTHGKN